MKSAVLATILISTKCLLATPQSQSTVTDIRIGLSPFLDQGAKQKVQLALQQFVLRAPAGTSIRCDDAFNLQTIAAFDAPRLRFDSPANRARTLAAPLAALARWFQTPTGPGQADQLRGSAALRAPEWFRQISDQPAAHPRTLLLFGSPLYVSTTEPAFSMPPDLYPGDGHLVASLEQSIYGLSDDTNRLAGTLVHWIFPTALVWANELHAYHLTRFWCLYVSLRGGCLADFSADSQAGFSRALEQGLAPVGHFELEPGDTKLTMRVARPREIPRWMPQSAAQTNTAPPTSAVSAARPITTAAPSKPTIDLPWQAQAAVVQADRPARPVVFAVGLMWEARADVDLYVTPPRAPELWFGNVLGPSGRYLHDFRDRNAGHDYEWVELWETFDPANVAAWVNYYAGDEPVRGTVCVYYQGRTYLSQFELRAPHGNRAADKPLRGFSPYWTKLDLARIVSQVQAP